MKQIMRTIMPLCLLALILAGLPARAAQEALPHLEAKRYNLAGQLTGIIQPASDNGTFPAVRHTYNNRGLKTRTEIGYLAQWRDETVSPSSWGSIFRVAQRKNYSYSERGWLTRETITSPSGEAFALTQYSYDGVGRVRCKAVRMNPSTFSSLPNACTPGSSSSYGADRISRYSYDSRGNLLREERAVGTNLLQDYVRYTYDGNNNQRSVTDANGNYAKMDYDGYDRLTHWYFPHPSNTGAHNPDDFERYTYDANGNRTAKRVRSGETITYHHDNLNRLVEKTLPGAHNVYYGYDLRGLQRYARFGSHSGNGINTDYSGFGELLSERNTLGSSTFQIRHLYDANGHRTRVTHPDNRYFTFEHDGLNRVAAIMQNGSAQLINYRYDDYGRSQSLSTGNNLTNTELD